MSADGDRTSSTSRALSRQARVVWSCCPVPRRSASRQWFGACASASRTCTSASGHDAGAASGRGRRGRLPLREPRPLPRAHRPGRPAGMGRNSRWTAAVGYLGGAGAGRDPRGIPGAHRGRFGRRPRDQEGHAGGHHSVLAPPSWEDLQARLVGRGTETPEAMARRLETARVELAAQDDFDLVVVNRQLESACAELVSLLVGNAPGTA